tara:strand:- start:6974 stop:7237 length:264 start_codon:yes stop_codon:yes gene_type:complete
VRGFSTLLKLISAALGFFRASEAQKKEQEYRDDVEEINADPVGQWNMRFLRGRVRDDEGGDGSDLSGRADNGTGSVHSADSGASGRD